MLKPDTCAELLALTDWQTVIDVVAIRALTAGTRPSLEEYLGERAFESRVVASASVCMDGDQRRASRAMRIMLACAGYENARALEGIGTRPAPSLRDALAECVVIQDPVSAGPGR